MTIKEAYYIIKSQLKSLLIKMIRPIIDPFIDIYWEIVRGYQLFYVAYMRWYDSHRNDFMGEHPFQLTY